jgi:hypothetical protein
VPEEGVVGTELPGATVVGTGAGVGGMKTDADICNVVIWKISNRFQGFIICSARSRSFGVKSVLLPAAKWNATRVKLSCIAVSSTTIRAVATPKVFAIEAMKSS